MDNKDNKEIDSLRLEIKDLKIENQRLQRETRSVAIANANAAKLMATLKEAKDMFSTILRATSSVYGENFFQILVHELAKIFNANFVVVGALNNDGAPKLETLAVWEGGKLIDNFAYDLAGTPCEHALGETLCFYPKDVRVKFPKDKMLVDLSIDSYLGATIFSSNKDALGLIAVLNKTPMELNPDLKATIKLFSRRAGMEFEQLRLIESLSEAKLSAESSSLVKTKFLASMSHELRTPMGGIIGMAELLLETELSSEQSEYANTVYSCANSLLIILNDILDFSKIETGKLIIGHVDFDLYALMDDIIDIFAAKSKEKNELDFFCFIDPKIPFLLRGDHGRLRQVIVNLAGNAIKFTEEGEVSINVMLDKETESHATLRFEINDTGIGIPEHLMHQLFQSFSQLDSSTTREYGGTGLGLAICKQIVDLMEGQIGVESQEGKGSTFWLTLTFEKQSADQQGNPFEIQGVEKMRMLIVDGNSNNRRIVGTYLESAHCRFTMATSAKEAMLELRAAVNAGDPFKVALLDSCIHDVDVESLCLQIKTDPQLKGLILVLLIYISQGRYADRIQELGVEAYLLKPVKLSQLLYILRTITGKVTSTKKVGLRQIVTRRSMDEDYRKKVRILLVEDNVTNQDVVLNLLERRLGYHVDIASNGKEAIEVLRNFDYDMVLMDCMMPKMDGYEATRLIRDADSSVKNQKITIIAMTANAMEGDREKCIAAGMDDYIAKPVKLRGIMEVVERHIRKDRDKDSTLCKNISA